ncbi:general secretion pathway protein K [Pseudoalteromonas ulvae UL12]|uniref:Type II secretion system protein K n=1 Tax=Pseudoalteromonas ulvae TaxID=107327 RepID=A0A244CQC0_PSEDV|nr:type II secretion system minor pseudopilin GspK [Pseudoalteromonas ulvae]MBE0364295.1 general secretion pathway protein K [Pseudoalteromonas ulvae UL12]OUL57389.1 general secretion pathway protein GspK [Pseudoalteromonas ulvae]
MGYVKSRHITANTHSQQGAALVIVLFVVALAATLAVEMSSRLMVQVQKSSNLQDYQQAKWFGYAAESLAKKVIKESKAKNKNKTSLDQVWAADETTLPVQGGGTISGKITDLQGCLNLNALRAATAPGAPSNSTNDGHKALFALIDSMDDLPIDETPQALADSVLDWVDANSNTYRDGAEEDEYLSRSTPYLTANHFLASISELRVIKGFNPLVMKKLTPFLCVIPGSDLMAINVNTIPQESSVILAALIDVDASAASSILSARPDGGWDSFADFYNEAKASNPKNLANPDPRIVINSNYFQLAATATYAESRFQLTTQFYVDDKDNVTILARKFGAVQ